MPQRKGVLMNATNGDVLSSSSATHNVGPSENVLTVAVQALTAIATEAQQAVRKLEGLPGAAAPAATMNVTRALAAMSVPSSAPAQPAAMAPAAVPNGPTAKAGQMNPGEVMHPGDSLTSPNGNYLFAMQRDGNLVLYSGTSALWASNTAGKPVAVCIMQADGNLVLYNASGQALWASNTAGKSGAHLEVQNDGNVVIYQTNGSAAWATNTVHTVGSDTLIYRARLKRWTNLFAFGTKGNDVLMVKLPPGATLKSVSIEAVDATDVNPNLNSSIGTQVGTSNSGARLTNVNAGPGFVAISTHWWFNAFSDAEYSIAVWVTGPTAYPVEDNGTLTSANLDSQISGQVGKWFENNEANLIAAGVAVATACIDIASLGTLAPVTTPVLIAAIGAAVAAGAKIALTPSN